MKADPVNGVLSSLPSVAATLSFLDLSRVNCLSDDSIDAISACEELKILNLEAAGEFHPASLTNLAKCSRLEYLNLSDTRHVDIHHLIELVSDLRSLKMLAVEGQNLAAHLAPAICTKAAWLETLAVWHVDEETLVAHMKRLVEAVGEEKVKLNHLYVANGDEISDETVDVMLKEFNCEIHQIFNWDELLPRNWLEIARIAVKKPVPQSVTDVDRDCRLENDKEDGEETKEELD